MLVTLLLCGLLAAPTESLVRDGGFELGRGWVISRGERAPRDGGQCLRLADGGTALQDLPAPPPGVYTAAVDVATQGVQPTGGPGYAYAAVYQLDARGEIVAFRDFLQLTGNHDWQRVSFTFETHPAAALLSLRCGLYNATGEARFDNWTLVAGDQVARFETVTERGLRQGSSGRAAVLRVPDLPVHGAPSSPEALASQLRIAGYEVDSLSDIDLANTDVLRADRYDLVALPYGESFPGAARETFTAFLRGGGSFLSVGGYAFQKLLYRDGDGWIDDAERVRRLNTAALDPAHSPLPDPGFESTTDLPLGDTVTDGRWRRNHEQARIVDTGAHSGKHCVRIDVAADESIEERKVWLDLPAEPRSLRVAGWLRTAEVQGEGFAYLAWYQYDADGKLLAWKDFAQGRGDRDWTEYHDDFAVLPATARLHLKAGLYRATGTVWIDDLAMGTVELARPMNTSNGEPRDGLDTTPDQLGVFDPSVPLQRVARLRGGAEHEVATPAHGWVAVGVLGNDNARWRPLLEARDRYERPRGAAMAMVMNHSGYYAGSVWGFCGVDDRDLFADPDGLGAEAFRQAAAFIRRGLWLHGLRTDQRLYHDGEPVQVTVDLSRFGPLPPAATVQFEATPLDQPGPALHAAAPVADTVRLTLATDRFAAPLYRLTATLHVNGQEVDRLETGFAVDRPETARSGPALRWVDNGLTLNGRRMFLLGTDTYSYTYHSGHDNPLTWAADHQACRDIGLDLYENLQYNNPGHAMAEADWRAFRAMAQSTQAHGLVFMPGMLIGHDVVTDDDELARQRAVCAGYAERLHDLPGLLYYINGDYQLRQDSHPDTLPELWRRWLLERYGDRAGIAAAWGEGAGANQELPFPPRTTRRWDDRVAVDRADFLTWLMTRWNQSHVDAVRAHDTTHPITSEYYRLPFGGMDLRLTLAGQDIANIGYFGEPEADLDDLGHVLRWNDRRANGQGLALGEYGVKTHPAWEPANGGRGYHIRRTMEQERQLFLTVGAVTLGAGGSKVQNWCLRDSQTRVFPWGLYIPNQLVPKDVAYTHRNQAALFRLLAPRDEPPEVTVCLPSRMRQGNAPQLGLEAGYRCIDTLLSLHVPCNVIDDLDLGNVPPTTRVMFLPSPFALADAHFDALQAWVSNGGKVVITGDMSYDEHRRETRLGRLGALCGLERVARLAEPGQRGEPVSVAFGGPALTLRPSLRVRATHGDVVASSGEVPVITRFRHGAGGGWFVADPLECGPAAEVAAPLRAIYGAFLAESGVKPEEVEPNEPELRLFSRPTETGRLFVAMHHARREGRYQATIATPGGPLVIGARYRWPCYGQVDRGGRVRLAMVDGEAVLGGVSRVRTAGLQGVAALDGRDLAESRELLLSPFEPGEIVLPPRPGRFVALVGEVLGGRWRTYERLALDGDGLRVTVDDDRCRAMGLLVEAGREESAVARVERLMQRPWELPGW